MTKHAVKQVDRLMSNAGVDVWDSFARWVPQQIAGQPAILVAMDWTDFAHDGQSTLVLSLVTGHGRAAPMIWLSVWKEEIATRRNDYEDTCLRHTRLLSSGSIWRNDVLPTLELPLLRHTRFTQALEQSLTKRRIHGPLCVRQRSPLRD